MVRWSLTLVVVSAALACRENRNMADRAVMPPPSAASDSTMIKNPMKADSMLDTMPGGEMARGNDSATMHLLKKKKRM
jgi:hypothetical protein